MNPKAGKAKKAKQEKKTAAKAEKKTSAPKPERDLASKFPQAKRSRQPQLPGTEDKYDEDLTNLALAYVDARDYRMQLTQAESDAKKSVLSAMATRKIAVYHDAAHGITVEVSTPEEVKLKVTVDDVQKGEGGAGLPPDPTSDVTVTETAPAAPHEAA